MKPMNSSKLIHRHRALAALVCAAALTLSSGCFLVAVGAAGAAGAGAVAYVRGELDATVTGNVESVDKATNKALEQLEFAKISEGKSTVDAAILARTGQDKKIDVRLNRSADNLTRVRIRVDTFGDEALSRSVLDKIKTNL
jgi:hypothetical protein